MHLRRGTWVPWPCSPVQKLLFMFCALRHFAVLRMRMQDTPTLQLAQTQTHRGMGRRCKQWWIVCPSVNERCAEHDTDRTIFQRAAAPILALARVALGTIPSRQPRPRPNTLRKVNPFQAQLFQIGIAISHVEIIGYEPLSEAALSS